MKTYKGKPLNRDRIVAYLKTAPFNQMSSAAIARDLNLSISTSGQALKELLDTNVVEREMHGKLSIYSLTKT